MIAFLSKIVAATIVALTVAGCSDDTERDLSACSGEGGEVRHSPVYILERMGRKGYFLASSCDRVPNFWNRAVCYYPKKSVWERLKRGVRLEDDFVW